MFKQFLFSVGAVMAAAFACGIQANAAPFLDDFSSNSSLLYQATEVLVANDNASFEGEAVYNFSNGELSLTKPTAISSGNRLSLQSTLMRVDPMLLETGERLLLDLPSLVTGSFGGSNLAGIGVAIATDVSPGQGNRESLLFSYLRGNGSFSSLGFDENGNEYAAEFGADLPIPLSDVKSIYIERALPNNAVNNDYTFRSGVLDWDDNSYLMRSDFQVPALSGDVRVGVYSDIRSNGFAHSVDNLRIETAPIAEVRTPILGVQRSWDLFATYGKEGHVGMRAFLDIDSDGANEVIFNLGNGADFVALELDGTEIWRSTIEGLQGKEAYYPKVAVDQGLLFFGSRATNTLHAVEIATGDLAWSRKVSTQGGVSSLSLEVSDVGVIAGHSGTVGQTVLFDFEGDVMPGWPLAWSQHEQLLGAGDLDGDGQDEFFLNNNNGQMRVYKRDGSLLFSRTSQINHNDYAVIANINQDPSNPNNLGNELLVALDDDGSHSGEGDEIVLLNALGNEVARYQTGSNGLNYAVGDVLPDSPGLEVFFGNEGSNTIGLLNHKLEPIFTQSLTPLAAELGISLSNAAGQTSLADLDGDGILELLINTGEHAEAGILAFNAEGDLFDWILGRGWDFDPQMIYSSADPRSKQLIDVDGDGRDDIIASLSGANTSTGDRTMYLLGNIVASGLPGDFNNDGQVNAMDYAVWRENLGATNELAIHFNGNGGSVTQADLTVWLANYGNEQLPLGPVPDPSASGCLLCILVLSLSRRNAGRASA